VSEISAALARLAVGAVEPANAGALAMLDEHAAERMTSRILSACSAALARDGSAASLEPTAPAAALGDRSREGSARA
jgi:hypothetical protein